MLRGVQDNAALSDTDDDGIPDYPDAGANSDGLIVYPDPESDNDGYLDTLATVHPYNNLEGNIGVADVRAVGNTTGLRADVEAISVDAAGFTADIGSVPRSAYKDRPAGFVILIVIVATVALLMLWGHSALMWILMEMATWITSATST